MMQMRNGARWWLQSGTLVCALALAACGGESAPAVSTATAARANTPIVSANLGTTPTPLIPFLPVTPPAANATADTVPAPTTDDTPTVGAGTVIAAVTTTGAITTAATPTPLAFGNATGTVRATTGAAVATAPRATAAPSTPITGSTGNTGNTSGTRAVVTVSATVSGAGSTTDAGTAASTASGTRVTIASGTTVASTPATRTSGTVAAIATEAAPTVRARDTALNFLNVVVRDGDLSGFLAPSLRGQDASRLLGINGRIREFVVVSEQPDPGGTGSVVTATITTTAGTTTKQLHMTRSGGNWVIDRIG